MAKKAAYRGDPRVGSPIPTVSDHAIIRYLERIKNVDMDAIRAEILTPERASAIRAGACRININGFSFVVKGNVICTIMEDRRR